MGVKISELSEATVAQNSDLLPIVQNGETKKITKENLFNDTKTELLNLETQISDLIEYSTNETKIGTWIDGKPIYRKVIEATSGFATDMFIPHGIENLDGIVDIKGWHNTLGFKPLPTIYLPDISNYCASIYTVNGQDIELTLSNWVVQRVAKIVIIIEYTKSTN